FGRGAGIDGEVRTGTAVVVVGQAIVRTASAVQVRVVVAAIERQVDAQIATELDASISARDVVESGTIQGANLHVLDRFGLDGKIGCLCPHPWREDPPLSRDLGSKPSSC